MPTNISASPIVSFHFFQNEIIKEFAHIFKNEIFVSKLKPNNINYTETISKMVKHNNIIFNDEIVVLFNFLEIKIIDEELITKFLCPLNKNMLCIVELLKNNYDDIFILMNKWKILLNKFSGLQRDVPVLFITKLKSKLINGKIKPNEIFPLGFQENINFYLKDLLDALNLKNKSYELFVKFDNNSNPYTNAFNYQIFIVENVKEINLNTASADLIRQLPVTKIYESSIKRENIDTVLFDLFVYGKVELNKSI